MRIATTHSDWQSKAIILFFEDWLQSLIVPLDYVTATAYLDGWNEDSGELAEDYLISTHAELGDTPDAWQAAMAEKYRLWVLGNRYPGDFRLDRSKEQPTNWLLTYIPEGIVIRWAEGEFNATQKVTLLDDPTNPDPSHYAAIMRACGDWLNEHCPWLCYPLPLTRSLLGTTCRYLRQARGYSIRDLAERAAVNKATIVNIEGGRFAPSIDVAGRVLAALGATLRIN